MLRTLWLHGTVLILNLVLVEVTSDPASDIATIKELLEVIFHRHRSEMEDLRARVEKSEDQVRVFQDDFGLRLFRIEQTLSRNIRAVSGQDPSDPNRPISDRTRVVVGDLGTRLDKLETLSRFKAPRSCHDLKRSGIDLSDKYFLDPDGHNHGYPPILVYCDMVKGETRLDHDLEGSHRVSSCQEVGCSGHRVEYAMPMSQMSALISLSTLCVQEFQYDCLGAPLNVGEENMAWWTGANGDTFTFWHSNGSNPGSACQCGSSKTCFNGESTQCNCDANNGTVWLQDKGVLTSRKSLPVTRLNFGGVDMRKGKVAKFQLGPLRCSGSPLDNKRSFQKDPASCEDLWHQGATEIGYYMVRSKNGKYPKVVFCDMSLEATKTGFERVYGSPGNLRYFAAFDVSLNAPFYDDFRYINFTTANLNSGRHFNIQDGIFTVPFTGTYLFSVHGLPLKRRPFKVQIHKNGVSVARLSNGESGKSMVGQTILLDIVAGDEIRLFNFGGDIFDDEASLDSYFHFIGVLLYSSDRE